jgi:DNA-binding transcriptional ArsR family regulator
MDRSAENILGSKGRLRILEVLAQFGELSMSKIIRSTGLNYTNTRARSGGFTLISRVTLVLVL